MHETKTDEMTALRIIEQELALSIDRFDKGDIDEKVFKAKQSSLKRTFTELELVRLGRKTMAKKQKLKRVSIWVTIILAVGGVVFGLYKNGVLAQQTITVEFPRVERRVEVLETGQKDHGEKIARLEEKVISVGDKVTGLKQAHDRFYNRYETDQRVQQADIKAILLKVGGER